MGRREYDQSCSLACALDRIGERWSLLIVRELSLGPLRFSDLARPSAARRPTSSPSACATSRATASSAASSSTPPASGTAYELTDVGRALERPLLELARWGLNFERVDDVVEMPPTSLPNAIRTSCAQPPPTRA